tara:strand:- start:267 stop:431 length:165 start_codon:yes stop_codon:yes gene_type:complete
MLSLKTPHGLDVKVPELDKEDLSPKFVLDQLDEISNDKRSMSSFFHILHSTGFY